MDIKLDDVVTNFRDQKFASDKKLGTDEEVLKWVYDSLGAMFAMPATPENMWVAKDKALDAVRAYREQSLGWFAAGLIGFVVSAGKAYGRKVKQKNMDLQKDPFYFMECNNITNPAAKAAVERGNATIGELFLLQPSIFIGD